MWGGAEVPVLPRYCTFRYTLEVGVTVVGRVITLNKAGSFEGRKGAMRKMLYVIVSYRLPVHCTVLYGTGIRDGRRARALSRQGPICSRARRCLCSASVPALSNSRPPRRAIYILKYQLVFQRACRHAKISASSGLQNIMSQRCRHVRRLLRGSRAPPLVTGYVNVFRCITSYRPQRHPPPARLPLTAAARVDRLASMFTTAWTIGMRR